MEELSLEKGRKEGASPRVREFSRGGAKETSGEGKSGDYFTARETSGG